MAKKKNDGYMVDGKLFSAKDIQEYNKAMAKTNETIERLIKSQDRLSDAQERQLQIMQKTSDGYAKMGKTWADAQERAYTTPGKEFKFDSTKFINAANESKSKSKQVPRSIAEWYNTASANAQKESADKILQEVSKSIFEKYKQKYDTDGNGITDQKIIDQMDKEIELEAAKKIEASAKNFGRFSGLMQVVSDTFSAAVKEFNQLVKSAIDSNYQNTETNLNKIVSTNYLRPGGGNLKWSSGTFNAFGSTYSGYNEINNAINDQLGIDGLSNNISVSDVMNGIAELTSNQGMEIEAAIAKAYQDTTIKYIVPYLDTTSEIFTGMEMRMPGLSKNIAATAISVREQLGQSQYLSNYINDLVKLMEPVSLQANKTLYADQFSAIAARLESEVASERLTASQANALANEAFQMYMDPTGTLKNGSTIAKMTTSGAISTGNIDNPAYYVDSFLNNIDTVLDWGGGDSLAKNIIGGAMIGDATISRKVNNEKDLNKVATSKGAKEELKKFDQMINGADAMNTTQQKIETYVGNITADIAEIKSSLGSSIWNVGSVIVSGITSYIGAKVIGGVIGKSLGKLGGAEVGGSGAGILSSAGGIALGTIAGVAAVTAISTAIMNAEKEKAIQQEGNRLKEKGSPLAGNTAAEVGGATNNLEQTNFWWDIAAIPQALGQFGNNVVNTFSSNVGEDNKRRYNNLLTSLQQTGWDAEERNEATLAFMLLLAGKNRLGDIGVTESDLKTWVESDEGPSVIDALGKIGKAPLWAYQPHDDNGKLKQIDNAWFNDTLMKWNYHRYGLADVPYDNYLASLHEGEAVLTASTASELRGLLDEYRNTNNQAVSFDAIIQTQTTALVTKLDEVISTIKTSGVGGVVTGTSTQANAVQKLNHSMLHMTSTKQL